MSRAAFLHPAQTFGQSFGIDGAAGAQTPPQADNCERDCGGTMKICQNSVENQLKKQPD
jgi:hypothetical protein